MMTRVERVVRASSAARQRATYTITRRARYWEVRDDSAELVCLTVYKCGAEEVVRRLRRGPAPNS